MAKIQTSDGFFVDVDVSILYRITDPYRVITTLGRGQGYLDKGILPRAEPALKKTLGELTTEQFYNSPMRVAKAEEARRMLDEELQQYGLEVQQVLVRFFEYSDEIQKNIEAKKLQDQLVFKNQSQARAAIEEAQRLRIVQEGEAKVTVTREEGQAYRVEKEAERDLYVRKKGAEADLLVQLAEAKRTELRNDAMQAVGADKAVALAMAEVLRGLEVLIIPSGGDRGLNPLDLNGLSALFGVQGTGPRPPMLPARQPAAPLVGTQPQEITP
jgi:regulator of protease activity HflC (stomatin/prohibitin superfamily)